MIITSIHHHFYCCSTQSRERVLLMTDEQKDIYNLVMDRVSSNLPLQLFVDARGGCGLHPRGNLGWSEELGAWRSCGLGDGNHRTGCQPPPSWTNLPLQDEG